MLILTQLSKWLVWYGVCGCTVYSVRIHLKAKTFYFLSALRWLGCGHIQSSLDGYFFFFFFSSYLFHFTFIYKHSAATAAAAPVSTAAHCLKMKRRNHQTNKQTPYTNPCLWTSRIDKNEWICISLNFFVRFFHFCSWL